MRHDLGVTVGNLIPGTSRPLGNELCLPAEAHRQGNGPGGRQAPGTDPRRAAWESLLCSGLHPGKVSPLLLPNSETLGNLRNL